MQKTLMLSLDEAVREAALWEVDKPREEWLFGFPAELALLAGQACTLGAAAEFFFSVCCFFFFFFSFFLLFVSFICLFHIVFISYLFCSSHQVRSEGALLEETCVVFVRHI